MNERIKLKMSERVEQLVEKLWDAYQDLAASKRLLIGIAGIPGSGKSTLASNVVAALNKRYRKASPGAAAGTSEPIARAIPMDGFHLRRAQLDAMADPHHARARRGAAFTFDAAAYLALIKELRAPLTPEAKTLHAPSFDHAVKDPVADDIPIPVTARILVFEGNYVALDEEPWREAAQLMDELWFVDVDFDVAKQRLIARHVASGIEPDAAAAARRADENDLINGREIVQKLLPVQETVKTS